MMFSVCFIERRDAESPSIERVFRSVAENLEANGVRTVFERVPFGNGIAGTLLNLLFFRPPPVDLVHITGHVNYLGLVLPRNRTISTIHDLTILNLRHGMRRWLIEKLFFVWPSRRLKFLTTVSDETKAKLLRSARVEPEKICVIQNPLLISHSGKKAFNVSKTRILQIGTAHNKNVYRLVSAVSGLSCELHIIGKISGELQHHLNEQKVQFSNDERLDDIGIEKAYESADLLTLCSTDEGFGLPIIEAQAKRTVVVTSDRSPMRDVAGGGAVLVDPEDVFSIRTGIVRVISEPSLREDMVAQGLQNIQRFDPVKIAGEYHDLYETVLNGLRK